MIWICASVADALPFAADEEAMFVAAKGRDGGALAAGESSYGPAGLARYCWNSQMKWLA